MAADINVAYRVADVGGLVRCQLVGEVNELWRRVHVVVAVECAWITKTVSEVEWETGRLRRPTNDEKVRDGLCEAETNIDDILGESREYWQEEVLKCPTIRRRASELANTADEAI